MKRVLLFSVITCWPFLAQAQDSINPYTIHQRCNIVLHNTDVYYTPYEPPGDSDTRANLCNESDQINDPNGVGTRWRDYRPLVYDTVSHGFIYLKDWPPNHPVGPYATWQRLFQALPKSDGTPTGIIAGGTPGDRVIISKNEDVDFRASGRVILKSGFHAKPGCFFHAYTDPKWDTTVFSDEFKDTAKFRNRWSITNGFGGNGYNPTECSSDSNVRLVPDSQAHDGWALDIFMREVSDTCNCDSLVYMADTCESVRDTAHPGIHQSYFSSAVLTSCPFPYQWRIHDSTSGPPAYAHAPYGKYEFRDKMPHVLHHNDDWGGGYFEWDLNETNNAWMGVADLGFGSPFRYGPAKGFFQKITDDSALFISHDTSWYWQHFLTVGIIVDNVKYPVTNNWWAPTGPFVKDTLVADRGWGEGARWPFPSSLINSNDTVTFYYTIWNHTNASNVKWTVTQATSDHKWRLFHAPYFIDSLGDSLLFSKDYQPTYVTLTVKDSFGFPSMHKYMCHWVDTLNHPNQGIIYLDDTMANNVIHNNTEPYAYEIGDIYEPYKGYPIPPLLTDTDAANWPLYDTTHGVDTFSFPNPGFNSSPYEYHTYTMEYLPHEINFFIDSNLVRRLPDRLIPTTSRYYDIVGQFPRYPLYIHASQLDLDGNGLDPNNIEKLFFDSHFHNPGCWDVTVGGRTYHAAHHLVDYIKVWDVPKDVTVPDYPH